MNIKAVLGRMALLAASALMLAACGPTTPAPAGTSVPAAPPPTAIAAPISAPATPAAPAAATTSQNVVVPAAASAQAPDLPTGRLRVGFDLGNVAFASQDPATGELRGVTVDLGRALAARLGVPFEPVVYENGAQLTAALRTGAFDVTHQPLDSEPAAGLDFGPVIVEVDNTYLVLGDSPIRRAADADRPGVRITASRGGAPGLFLERNLKQATLVLADTGAAAFELLRAGQADAYAANRQIQIGRAHV